MGLYLEKSEGLSNTVCAELTWQHIRGACPMSEATESRRGSGKMAAIGHTVMVDGGTKTAERESSIIKAKTRTRDKGRGMRWKRAGGGRQNKDNSSVGGIAGENKRG